MNAIIITMQPVAKETTKKLSLCNVHLHIPFLYFINNKDIKEK